MRNRFFGIETEYGVGSDAVLSQEARALCVEALLERARQSVPHLNDQFSNGIFLRTGGRFYLDVGPTPEMTTPECDNPWDLVRYVLAGERILERLAQECSAAGNPCFVFRCQVDYSGATTTWGCHESYMYGGPHESLADDIIPHLVSRIVFTGAGGFDNQSAGIEFLVSPRVAHLTQAVSDSSTSDRGIFHTKNEPLAAGEYNRLHLLCGESLCSELATWLKVGTTALVVALIDGGVRPGDAIELDDPLAAMRRFARDPSCTASVRMATGRMITAVGIQRHYLAQVEAHASRSWMPPWTGKVCRRWRAVLDALEHGPAAVIGCVDWALKLAVYRSHLHRRGVDWESLAALNRGADQLVRRDGLRTIAERVRAATLRAASPTPPVELTFAFPSRGMPPTTDSDLDRMLVVREELFELDTRFGRLGKESLFAQLEEQGLLRHHVPGVDNIEHAVSHPPANGRARVRGEVITQLTGDQPPAGGRGTKDVVADWQGIWDLEQRRYIDLSDPFATSDEWKPMKTRHTLFTEAGRRLTDPLAEVLGRRQRRRPP